MQAKTITPKISIAGQPTEADLQGLKAEGYEAVLNLRTPGEPEQPLSPDEVGQKVREQGLEYLHHGIVGNRPLAEQGIESALKFLDDHADKRVLVHCRRGGRAAALVLIQQARAQGWSSDEALEKGKAMGLDLKGSLRALVEKYLTDQS